MKEWLLRVTPIKPFICWRNLPSLTIRDKYMQAKFKAPLYLVPASIFSLLVSTAFNEPPSSSFIHIFLFVFFLSFFFLAAPCSLQDLSSPARDGNRAPQWKCRVLTTGPPGNSHPHLSFCPNCPHLLAPLTRGPTQKSPR